MTHYTEDKIICLIKDLVKEVTQVEVKKENTNLLDTELEIHPADFLYIFNILEQKLEVPVTDILKGYDYTIMRIDNMSRAILKLIKDKEK